METVQSNFLDLNLLPGQRPRKTKPASLHWLGWLLLAFALFTLIPLWQLKSFGDTRVQNVRQRLEQVREQVRHVDDLLAEKESLARSLDETITLAGQLEREAAILQTHRSLISERTTTILDTLPPRTRLEDITQEGSVIKIRGWAGSASVALSYARALQEQRSFRRVNVTTLDRRNSDPVPTAVTFVIELE